MCTKLARLLVAATLIAAPAALMASAAEAHTTGIHDNCTNLNKKWPHGVGKAGAVDSGGSVTNFTRNTAAYKKADRHNGTLDRDNDGIACEKA